MSKAFVEGTFDDIKSLDLRFLEEAAKSGPLTVLLRSDEAILAETGKAPRFPFAERQYFLAATRFVADVVECPSTGAALLAWNDGIWVEREGGSRQSYCREHGIAHRLVTAADLSGFPEPQPKPVQGPKVVVTGCYDWFHSGHVRFFEEASAFGALYVVVGHDRNIRALKGEGHPLLPEAERRYVVGAIKHVTQALISTGEGWLDADPQIKQIKPDYYVVNEDGDKGGKREYCESNGIQYKVLRREPAPGLPKRSSTDLRGF